MNQILYTIFADNPNLPEEIYRYCQTIPQYRAAEKEFRMLANQALQRLGFDFYARLEEATNARQAQECWACYLFGVGLRGEVREFLEEGGQSPKCPSTPTPTVTARNRVNVT